MEYSNFYTYVGQFSIGCDWSDEGSGDPMSCCSNSHQCGEFEGDCDEDNECVGILECGVDNCFDHFDSRADCCFNPYPSEKIMHNHNKEFIPCPESIQSSVLIIFHLKLISSIVP